MIGYSLQHGLRRFFTDLHGLDRWKSLEIAVIGFDSSWFLGDFFAVIGEYGSFKFGLYSKVEHKTEFDRHGPEVVK